MRSLLDERLRLLRLLAWANARALTGMIVLGLLTTAAPLGISLGLGAVIRDLQSGAGPSAVILPGIAIAVSVLILQQSGYFKEAFARRLGSSIDGRVREQVRDAAARHLPLAVVESPAFRDDASRACDPGSWVFRSRTSGAAAGGQLWLMFRVLSALALGALIATINVYVALITVVGCFVIRAVLRRQWVPFIRLIDEQAPLMREADAIESSFADPRYAREFAVFGFGPWLVERWRGILGSMTEAQEAALRRLMAQQWITGVAAVGIAVAAFGLLTLDTTSGRIAVAQAAIAITAVTSTLAMSNLGPEAWDIDYGLPAVRALDRINMAVARQHQSHPITFADEPLALPEEARPPTVTLENVEFGYGAANVLRGITLALNPGEKVAIVGRNGAGKSTLMKLIAGLYEPSAGSLRLDGIPTSTAIGRQRAVAKVGAMYQQSLRLPLDLRSNVTFGAAATDSSVWQALDAAGVGSALRERSISLDSALWNGDDEVVDLSGGQWQRIALARAIFSASLGKKILILDEPTAHFDIEGEATFYNSVMQSLSDLTVILVTHRLSTIRAADRIVLIENGQVAEAGTHEELIARQGQYAEMFDIQSRGFRDAL